MSISKIKNAIYKVLYALPFGLKAADNEILGNGDDGQNTGTEVKQQVSDQRVAKHLLKGEVTQEVVDLRYRTYKVEKESKKYDYIGNGIAIKKDFNPENDNKIKFSQECKIICSDILTELKRVGDYGEEHYTLDITYDNPFVRFRLEQFATMIDVDIEKNSGKVTTALHFNALPNVYEKKSMPFISEIDAIKRALDNISDDNVKMSYLQRNEIASSMVTLSFTTFKASNDYPDLVSFVFTKPELVSVTLSNNEYVIMFSWGEFTSDNLTDKFFSENMERKYRNKEKKEIISDVMSGVRTRYCAVCGKEIPVCDGDILEYDTGKPMCIDCYKRYLKNEEKI